ncbi:MAG: squalene/phytoene synthase family protein [Firmicutes bacterium]|jgi:phytoene synthase|nr:squalene/phytoene synthase family protein [Bacillota bacterium]
MTDIQNAYQHCETITKEEARNFYYGIRLLTPDKRNAMSALYAFARRVDDVGDSAEPRENKLIQLKSLRSQVEAMENGSVPQDDLVLLALADAVKNFNIPTGALDEIVSGCEQDCNKTEYATIAELIQYCQYVAGSVGRLSLAVFSPDPSEKAFELANTLGLALQLTNILRDIVEDRDQMNRVYLPLEDLDRFGIKSDVTGPLDKLAELIRFEVNRAREYYAVGFLLLDHLDFRSGACVRAMAGIYLKILNKIDRDPLSVFEKRTSLSASEKIWVAAKSLTGVRP